MVNIALETLGLALFKIPHCILVLTHVYLEGRRVCCSLHPCVTKVL